MISNLPISCGDKIYMILLTQSPYISHVGRSGVYPTDHWFPRSLPVLGEYADYGRIEPLPEEAAFVQFVLDQLKVDCIEVAQGPNEYHDPEVIRSKLNWAGLDEQLHDARIWVSRDELVLSKPGKSKFDEEWAARHRESEKKRLDALTLEQLRRDYDWRSEHWLKEKADQAALESVHPGVRAGSSPVCRVYVRKDVYDYILKTQQVSSYPEIPAADFIKSADTLIRAFLKAKNAEGEDKYRYGFTMFAGESTRRDNVFGQYVQSGGDMFLPLAMSPRWVLDQSVDACLEGKCSIESTLAVATRVAEQIVIHAGLQSTRRSWAPTTGTGSQDEGWFRSAEMLSAFARIGYEKEIESIANNWQPGSSLLKKEDKYAKEGRLEGTERVAVIAKNMATRRDVIYRKIIALFREADPKAVPAAIEKKVLKELRLV